MSIISITRLTFVAFSPSLVIKSAESERVFEREALGLRVGFLAPPAPAPLFPSASAAQVLYRGGPVLQHASWLHAKSKHSRETPVSKDPNLMQRNVGASGTSWRRADDEG